MDDARRALRLADLLGRDLPVPDFLDSDDLVQSRPQRHAGRYLPWLEFTPKWLGWRSLGLSPGHDWQHFDRAEEFLKRFFNSAIISVSASALAVALGSLRAYGLSRFSYRFGFMRNSDISFFFLSQLILPPVVLALPFLVLYKELALLDTRIGMIAIYTLMVLPIVIWIMRDQFASVPWSLRKRRWSMVFRSGAPSCASSCRWCCPAWSPPSSCRWCCAGTNISLRALLTATDAKTLPVMIASQTGSQGINWWSMAALSARGILPLVFIGVLLEKHIIKGMTAGAVK